jgi:hypothetical protein
LEKEIIDLDLQLDCGNFTCNDAFAVFTDKVLEQNPQFIQKGIEKIIENSTGRKPVVLTGNKNDTIGHIVAV